MLAVGGEAHPHIAPRGLLLDVGRDDQIVDAGAELAERYLGDLRGAAIDDESNHIQQLLGHQSRMAREELTVNGLPLTG